MVRNIELVLSQVIQIGILLGDMLEQLDRIDWATLQDAYGSATTVPISIRSLLSPLSSEREAARWQLSSTIYHQGDIFDSTAAAIPFLNSLFSSPSTPERAELGELIMAIVKAAATSDEKIIRRWKREFEQWPGVHEGSESEKSAAEIQATQALRRAILLHADRLSEELASPPDELASICSKLQRQFEKLSRMHD